MKNNLFYNKMSFKHHILSFPWDFFFIGYSNAVFYHLVTPFQTHHFLSYPSTLLLASYDQVIEVTECEVPSSSPPLFCEQMPNTVCKQVSQAALSDSEGHCWRRWSRSGDPLKQKNPANIPKGRRIWTRWQALSPKASLPVTVSGWLVVFIIKLISH